MRTSSVMGSVVAVVGSLALGVAAEAAILVPGGDFEDVVTGPSGSNIGQINLSTSTLPWARSGGGVAGVLEILGETPGGAVNTNFNPGFYSGLDLSANGYYVGFTQGIGTKLQNTLETTYTADTEYTLTALVGNSYGGEGAGTFTLQLEDATTGTVLASTTEAYPVSSSRLVTVTLNTADFPDAVGNPIRIAYIGGATNTQAFDNVTLVPEPAAMSLLGLGALGWLRRRRA